MEPEAGTMELQGTMEPQASDCLLYVGRSPDYEEPASPARQVPVAAPRSTAERLRDAARRCPAKALAVGSAVVLVGLAAVWLVLPRAVGALGHAASTHGLSWEMISQEVKPLRGMLTIGGEDDMLNPCFTGGRAYNPVDMVGAIPLAAGSAEECQQRCRLKSGCKYFSFDHVTALCHLEDGSATIGAVPASTFIAGPAVCPTTTATTTTATTATTATATTATTATTAASEAPTTASATTATTVAHTTVAHTTAATTEPPARATTQAPNQSSTRPPTQPPTQAPNRLSTQPPTTQPSTTEAPDRMPALYCFMMTMEKGYEPDLVRQQVARHAGIFICEVHEVFSTGTMDLGGGIVTKAIGVDLSKKGPWGSWLNTENFLQAWDTILSEGKYKSCDWTVKADPDAVFMADRLQLHLKNAFPHGTTGSYYIKNCPKSFGLMGSLEVFSTAAVETFGGHREMCRKRFHPADSGEDGYMQACMWGSGVKGKEDFTLLVDGYCGQGSCQGNTWNVAFHPYKDTQRWFECWDQVVAAR